MKSHDAILLIFVIGMILSCCSDSKSTLTAKRDDLTKDSTAQEPPKPAVYFSPSKIDNLKQNSLFVFVGEKIEVNSLAQKEVSLDSLFLAKYKVLEQIYGNYSKDTIEFEVYDHYGVPPFSKYKYVLLFVSVYKGKLYHEKYQYFDLYKTKDGRWASPYSSDDYKHEDNRGTSIKPEKIEFADNVHYDVSSWDKKRIKEWYPAPYYQVDRSKAVAIYGNYISELLKLKRNGILKARELF